MLIKTTDAVNCPVAYSVIIKAGVSRDIFVDGLNKVLVTSGDGKWQITSTGTLSDKIKTCWGVTSPVDIPVPFSAIPQCKDPVVCIDDGRACYFRTDCCVEPGSLVSCMENVCTYRPTKGGIDPLI